MANPSEFVHGRFNDPKAQLNQMNELRMHHAWGISDRWFTQAENSIPEWPDGSLTVVTLVPYLYGLPGEGDSVRRTFEQLWSLVAAQHPSTGATIYDGKRNSYLGVVDGGTHEVGLRWEVMDLGCRRNTSPESCRRPELSPHAGILASAVLHPEWIRAMDGDTVPFVYLPGYEVHSEGDDLRWTTRCLSLTTTLFSDHHVNLNTAWPSDYGERFAVPSFLQPASSR